MNDKVASVIETLSKYFYQTCSDVDNFMNDIFEWSKEVEEILKNECLAKAGGPDHILPVIYSEKKTNNKSARNNVISTTSVLNGAECGMKNIALNETVSRNTRAARMTRSTKALQLNDTNEKNNFFNVIVKKESSIGANNNTFVMPQTRLTRSKLNAAENLRNETFIVPQIASARTRPVVKKKQEKNEGDIKERMEDDAVLKHSYESFQSILQNELITAREFETFSKTPSEKKNSSFQSKNSAEKTVRVKASRTLSKSPVRRPSKFSKTHHGSSTKTPTANALEDFTESAALNCSEILVTPTADSNLHKTYNRNETFSNINCSEKRNNTLKLSESMNNSPILEPNKTIVPDTPNSSPLLRSSSLKDYKPSNKSMASTTISGSKRKNINRSKNSSKENHSTANGTLEKNESSENAATFLVSEFKEKKMSFEENEKKISPLLREKFKRFSKTSTPVPQKKKKITSFDNKSNETNNENSKEMDFGVNEIADKPISENSNSDSIKTTKNKKKAKQDVNKDKIDEAAPTFRITRTKSKALQQMMEKPEINQFNELSVVAKKIVNKAKKISLKKSQVSALLEKNFITPSKPKIHLHGELFSSKSKNYRLLLSSSKKAKTPLATLPNSVIKIVKSSVDKTKLKPKIARRDSSAENLDQEREEKLKSKQKKEEEAATKRQNVIKSKQEELKRKNERKHQLAMKQREKLEQEKYKNMIQSEKEKEERHKLILQERQMKMKEEAFKKKMLTQQKIAETNERRRLEEEARIAKLKEMEAEEQRIALEKQKEQEMLEKRAQERLAQKKAREEYEIQLKKELEAERMKAEKLEKKKLQSASKPQPSKRQKFEFFNEKKEEWDYKPRNEDDYGLEHEESFNDSEDENNYKKSAKSPVPWVKKMLKNSKQYSHMISLDMLCEYMYCIQKTPDLNKMFNITPTKKIKRNSSAIWNTPSS